MDNMDHLKNMKYLHNLHNMNRRKFFKIFIILTLQPFILASVKIKNQNFKIINGWVIKSDDL